MATKHAFKQSVKQHLANSSLNQEMAAFRGVSLFPIPCLVFIYLILFVRTSTRPLLRSWDPIGNKLAPIARLNGLSWFVNFGVSVPAILDGIVAGCDLPAVHFVVM